MSVVMDSSVQTNRQLQLRYRSAACEVTRANLLEPCRPHVRLSRAYILSLL
jgi:hypothetical protein